MIIDVSDIITIPMEIEQKILERFQSLPCSIVSKIKECKIEYDRDVCCAIEDYIGPSSAYYFYRELCVLFEKYEMICYHSTKTLDEKIILTSGLQTNEWNAYSTHIIKTLHTLEASEEEITQAVEAIKKKYDWKYPSHGREPQLCFYSDTGLLSEDMHAGYEQFCENIGGELARDALKNEYPQLYEYLRANGKAFLVKFKIPFSNIKDYNQDFIIYQFVSYFAGKYFWNYDYEIHFDGNTDKEIPATDILELIPYIVNRYYFYE